VLATNAEQMAQVLATNAELTAQVAKLNERVGELLAVAKRRQRPPAPLATRGLALRRRKWHLGPRPRLVRGVRELRATP
jgi:hypothetical protein